MDRHYRWIINNFFHDFASGMWAAGLLVVWRLAAWRASVPAEAAQALAAVALELFYVMLASLVVIFATGGVRLRYWRNQNTADEVPYKRRSLLVKHALYLVVYGAGTVWAWFLLP